VIVMILVTTWNSMVFTGKKISEAHNTCKICCVPKLF
jgi:hypothetical protein